MIALLAVSAPALAQSAGGSGGAGNSGIAGGAGGTYATSGAVGGASSTSGQGAGGGGGGGVAAAGGAGGNDLNNAGGGTAGGAGGGTGGNATTGDGGGGGGGGGTLGEGFGGSGSGSGFNFSGGAGGKGGNATNGGGGGGGSGGSGFATQNGPVTVTIDGSTASNSLQGGNGGMGGTSISGVGGRGGDGGAGVSIQGGGSVITLGGGPNATTVTGGTGGSGGAAGGLGGNGGAGIEAIGAGVSIILGADAAVTGGDSFAGVRANAITFTGGSNLLELQAGYSVIGNVVDRTGNGTLQLGGANNSSFDVSTIGSSAQYQGFATFIKTGSSTWTLNNTTTAVTPWTISQGALAISSDGALGAASGTVTMDGGTLKFLSGLTSTRNFSLNSNNANAFDVAGNSVTLSGIIADGNGSGGFTLLSSAGSGVLTLTNANSYTDVTTIGSANATLALKGSGSIANSLYVAFFGGGALDISQTTAGASVGGLYDPIGGSKVFLGSQTLTITSGAGPFSGVIQDGGIGGGTGGGVTIAGAGPQTFNNTNTYTGLTTINQNAELDLSGGGDHPGSIATSRAVIDDGVLDVSGLSNGATSIKSLSGSSTGTVFLGAGTLTLTKASGTFAGTLSDGGNNGGSGGSLALTGGKEILTGTSTYTGSTTVTGGTLEVDGAILNSSSVTVNAGGTLTGTGTVDPFTVSFGNGATFTPGTAGVPGTSMTIAGNLSLASGSTYQVYLNPTTSTFANVTGTATLGGATANAFYANGSYISKQYTILTAAAVSGTFGSLVNTNLPANFSTSLSYDPTHAYLDLALNFTPTPTPGPPNYSGLNGNQQNVANALTNFFNASGGIPTVFGTLTPTGLTQASGELATGSQQTTFDAMNLFIGLLTDPFIAGRSDGPSVGGGNASGYADGSDAMGYAGKRKPDDALAAIYTKAPPLTPTFQQRWSTWVAGYGGSQTTDGNAALGSNNTTSSVYGTAVGADYRFSPDTLAGFAIAGGGTNFSVANSGTGRSDLFQAGAFLRHSNGPAYLSAALAYGWQDVTTNRSVTIAGLDQYQARFNANAWSGRLEGGYRFVTPYFGGLGVTPYAAGQFTSFDLPAYAEGVLSGAGTFALAYNARSVTDTRSELGLRGDKSFVVQGGILTLRSRFAWAHDYDPDRSIAATFQTLPGASFVVNGARQASDSALTTASAEMKWTNGWSAAATFEGEFSDVTASYAGKGVVRYVW